MDKFEAAFAKWVPRHRWFIIPLALIAVAACSIGTKNLYFDSSYKIFFGKDNPELSAFESIENTYSKYDNAMVVIAPTDGDVFTPATLAAVVEATDLAWQVPYSNRVDSITNFQFTEGLEDDLVVRDMVSDPGSLSADDIALIRQRVLAEPILFKRLISESGHVTAVNVTVQIPPGEQTTSAPIVVAHVRALARDLEAKYPHIKVYLTGMVLMNYSFSEQAMADSSTLIPLSFLVMAVILALLVGGFAGTVSALLIICFSIVVAMGVGGFMDFPITSPTAAAPVVILTVAVANCVHVLVTFLHEMRHGLDKISAMEESLRVNLQPVTVASVTTAIGFLTIAFSEVPPFQHLGIIVAIGVVTSFVLSVTFLPAVLTLLPVQVKQTADDDYKAIVRFSEFVIRYRRSLLWGMSALIVFVTANIPRNELNDVFLHYFHEPIQFRLDSDYTVENLTGLYTVQFSLKAGESGGISNPDFLRDVDRFAGWLRGEPEIIHIDTFTDVMKRLNRNMHADDEAFFHLPQDRNLAAQYLLLYEMSLPYGLDLNNQINVDKSSTRVTATIKTISSNELIAFDRRANEWLAENAPAVAETVSAGTTLMFSNIGKRNIRAMLVGTTVALVLISMIMIFALRSLKIGIISLLPNLAPGAMGFGLWGIFVGEVGLALSVVTSMTLGIVVDDSVHFLSKYLRARRENKLSSPDAVRYAFRTVGRALLVTSIVLVAGFMVLAQSNFELNAGMGLLTAVIIALGIFVDFLFLPPLLMKIEGDNDPSFATDTADHGAAA